MSGRTFASIDLGTNNCRMVIAKQLDCGQNGHSLSFCESKENLSRSNNQYNKPYISLNDNFEIVQIFSRITRLGEGLAVEKNLKKSAMKRTVDVLKKCSERLSEYDLDGCRYVATAACREAKNSKDFVEAVKNETGIDIEIISPDEEGRLVVVGCEPLIRKESVPSYVLVFDIGGGSTELTWVSVDPKTRNTTHIDTISIPLGVVTVSEGCLGVDISIAVYRTVIRRILKHMQEFDDKNGIGEKIAAGDVQFIGSSGTVTTLGAFIKNLQKYDRFEVDGMVVDLETIEEVNQKLRNMSYTDRKRHPCIGAGRADLVIAGCAILEAIYTAWEIEEITIADRGLREGILLDLMNA
ncbi:MAG: Ppx/GppA family phosphatase [Alphaproteobacteria bacterium]|nr:Ppx/GppA family phosphatase [Alphaproteobacteria bacterium]